MKQNNRQDLENYGRALAGELVPPGAIIPAAQAPDPRGTLYFSRYSEDQSLRLYKKGSLVGDEPAGYNDQEVTVKILVVKSDERFMVCLPITRARLSRPDAEQWLAEMAWEHRS